MCATGQGAFSRAVPLLNRWPVLVPHLTNIQDPLAMSPAVSAPVMLCFYDRLRECVMEVTRPWRALIIEGASLPLHSTSQLPHTFLSIPFFAQPMTTSIAARFLNIVKRTTHCSAKRS